ncbi:MAG TPA: DoxX family protein [Steroidobacteraceae bacterium]|nr:DoxX family protein [Steroidobacteraceae bacterium]
MASRDGSTPSNVRDWKYRTGWVLSWLAILFLVMDSTMKLLALPVVLDAGAALGLVGARMARALGTILMVCTILYAVPRTTVLGAILLTGFLGGTVATHLRAGDPLFSHVLFGVYLGVVVWAGIYLRDVNLRMLVPTRKN